MSRDQFCPNWPMPVAVADGPPPEQDMVNLSALDPVEKREAFKRLKDSDPDLAEFVSAMGRSFGRFELYVDKQTAARVGGKPKQGS